MSWSGGTDREAPKLGQRLRRSLGRRRDGGLVAREQRRRATFACVIQKTSAKNRPGRSTAALPVSTAGPKPRRHLPGGRAPRLRARVCRERRGGGRPARSGHAYACSHPALDSDAIPEARPSGRAVEFLGAPARTARRGSAGDRQLRCRCRAGWCRYIEIHQHQEGERPDEVGPEDTFDPRRR